MRIGIVAGEASGDLLGASFMRAILSRYPHARFEGIAGPRMQALGARSLYPMDALAVRGYAEVLRSLPRLLWMRHMLKRYFLHAPPDCFVGIDAPDFNLGLEFALKRGGIPTLQVVAPTVWAWRADRLPGIRRAVSGVLSIFPFEKPIFEQAGIPLTYVGHPLVQQLPVPDREQAKSSLGMSPDHCWVALLPGSRRSELEYHGPLFLEVARRIHENAPQVRFVVPLINPPTRKLFEQQRQLARYARLPIRILDEDGSRVLAAADAALVASGTATLEAALLECPMILTYRLSGLTAWLFRRKRVSRFVGLPNIILGREVVPEILQEEATAERLSEELAHLLKDASRRSEMVKAFRSIRNELEADVTAGMLAGFEQARHAT